MIESLYFQLSKAAWQTELQKNVINHLSQYRQTSIVHNEAGGQLYARSLTSPIIRVELATGPYPGDIRSHSRYTMKGNAATKDRAAAFKQGYLLCGLWHTHQEPAPVPSVLDKKAIQDNLALLPEWDALLLIIQGTLPRKEGLYIGVLHRRQGLHRLSAV